MIGESRALVKIELFGPDVRIRLADLPLPGSLAPKTRALLAYLILRAPEGVRRETVASALWPDVPDAEARKNLRRHLSLLLAALARIPGADRWIDVREQTLRWDPASPPWIDAREFERLGASALTRASAVDLYRGDLLDASAEEWLEPFRAAFRDRAIDWLVALFETHEGYDDDVSLRFARRILDLDPLREDILRRAMTLRVARGDRAGALRDFAEFESRLWADLAVKPDAETLALADRIRLEAARPPLRGIDARANTPRSRGLVTRFVGRDADVRAVEDVFVSHRAVTIVGVGGLGKSRLAHHVAERIEERTQAPVGIFRIPQSGSADTIVADVCGAFGLSVRSQSREDALGMLADAVGDRDALLVLDSCEHEPDAVRSACRDLLERCSGLRILATSRTPIGMADEALYRLGPLTFAEHEDARSDAVASDAVTLFLESSRSYATGIDLTVADREALARICRTLGGIPLAIELAAARRRMFGIVEIADRLEDPSLVLDSLPDGERDQQRTIRETIAWSYEALSEGERAIFRAISVFEAPFAIDAIEWMARAVAPSGAPINALSTLIDRSLILVVPGESGTRYTILDPLRQFGHRTMLSSGEGPQTYARALAYFCDLCDRLGLPEGEPDPRSTFASFAADHPNVRGVLLRLRECGGRPAEAVSLVTRLSLFWQLRGYAADGRSCITALLAGDDPDRATPARCELLIEASTFSRLAGAYDDARASASDALRLATELDRSDLAAEADFALAVLDFTERPADVARRTLGGAAARFEALDQRGKLGRCKANIALTFLAEGDHDGAATEMREAIDLLQRTDRRRWLATSLGAMGYIERYRNDLDAAARYSRDAFAEGERTGDMVLATNALANLAFVAISKGDAKNALGYVRSGLRAAADANLIFCSLSLMESAGRLLVMEQNFEAAAAVLAALSSILVSRSIVRAPEDRELVANLERTVEQHLPEVDILRIKRRYGEMSIGACLKDVIGLVDVPQLPMSASY